MLRKLAGTLDCRRSGRLQGREDGDDPGFLDGNFKPAESA
jgi:hypothetical protein